MRQRTGALVVAAFAMAFINTPWLIPVMNPVLTLVLRASLPAGPNALLTVRGRRSGRLRSTPVAVLDHDETCLVQAAFADAAWVRNLRASGEATLRRRGRTQTYIAQELDPDTAGRMLHDLLASFPVSWLVRRVLGPVNRPPIAVLYRFQVRVDSDVADYVALCLQEPVFELRRLEP